MVEISDLSRRILRELCTDSRITITELSEKYKISRHSISERIAALEKALDIHYTLELNYENMGFGAFYIINVKFSKKPKISELKKIFMGSKATQFAAITEGDFDLLIFALAKDSSAYMNMEVGLGVLLSKYGVRIRSSQAVLPHLGFVPVSNETIMEANLEESTKRILVALNEESRMPIRDLSKRIGLKEDITRYQLGRINNQRLIKAYTAVMRKPVLKNNIVFFANYATINEGILKRIERERKAMYLKPETEVPVQNEFQMMISSTGADFAFIWASYNDIKEGMKASVETHRKIYSVDNPKMSSAVIKEVIKGEMPIRNIDVKSGYHQNEYLVTTIP